MIKIIRNLIKKKKVIIPLSALLLPATETKPCLFSLHDWGDQLVRQWGCVVVLLMLLGMARQRRPMSTTLVLLLRTPCWIQFERSPGTHRWCSTIKIFCFSAACFVLCSHFTVSALPQRESLQRARCRYQGFLRSACRFYFFLFSSQKARFQSQPLITNRALVSLLLTLKFLFLFVIFLSDSSESRQSMTWRNFNYLNLSQVSS